MKEKFIKLDNGEIIHHGDEIYATLAYNDEYVDVFGRLCINDEPHNRRDLYICQDECNGDPGAQEKFEYSYSWSFMLNDDGTIKTTDTIRISKYSKKPLPEIVEEKEDVDDDPMPADWTPEEELPKDF